MPVWLVCQNPTCTQKFSVTPGQLRKGRYRYCSRPCYNADRGWFVEERFWAKVEKSPDADGCWIWIGNRHPFGYGNFQLRKNIKISAHRFAYERYVGVIPEGYYVCHKCDVPSCLRPDHLFLGTQSDNIKDAYNKKRILDGFQPAEKNHQAKMTNEQVFFIKESRGAIRGVDLAKMFHVHPGTIYAIWHNRSWVTITQD